MALALIVGTALGAVAGFLAARSSAAKEAEGGVRPAEPAPALEAVEAVENVDEPATGVALAEEATAVDLPVDRRVDRRVDLPAHLTDAEIDALPPELPPFVQRRPRKSPSTARRFDRL